MSGMSGMSGMSEEQIKLDEAGRLLLRYPALAKPVQYISR
jgi:hypothetical protein